MAVSVIMFAVTWRVAIDSRPYIRFAFVGQWFAVTAMLLTILAPGKDGHFFRWPLVCRWLFAVGFTVQLASLIWMTAAR